MDRIADMMSEDSGAEESSVDQRATGSDRTKNLMDMDYEEADKSIEPVVEDKKPDAVGGSKSEKKEEKEEKKEKKEEKKEDKKEEEKKPESTKKKIKYKVDGEEVEEEVDEQDLINNYSGQKAIQKRFTEFDKAKKEFEAQKKMFDEDLSFVKSEIKGVRDSFESVIQSFSKEGFVKENPLNGVYNLLDKMGLDAKEYDKAMFFHYLPEVSKFLDLDETGREAYLLRKDNEWLSKSAQKIEDQKREAAEYRAKLEKENSIKVQAGISEEKYSELANELKEKFNLDKLTTEQVVEWNQLKPIYERAERLSQMVENKVDPVKLTKIIAQNPEVSDEKILDFLGYGEVLKKQTMEQVKDRLPPKPPSKSSVNSDDDDFFNQFRRR